MARNPLKDTLAVVGVGSTQYGRDLGRSRLALGLDAATKAGNESPISDNSRITKSGTRLRRTAAQTPAGMPGPHPTRAPRTSVRA